MNDEVGIADFGVESAMFMKQKYTHTQMEFVKRSGVPSVSLWALCALFSARYLFLTAQIFYKPHVGSGS
jgi:hypothetical protein